MIPLNPQRIPGRWRDGFALDLQTISSEFFGHDEYGHPRFDTKRPPAGDLLYRLKYRPRRRPLRISLRPQSPSSADGQPAIEMIVPVPPSRARTVQPVLLLGEGLATGLGIGFCPDCV